MQVLNFKREHYYLLNGLTKINTAIAFMSSYKENKQVQKALNQLYNAKYILEKELKKGDKLG